MPPYIAGTFCRGKRCLSSAQDQAVGTLAELLARAFRFAPNHRHQQVVNLLTLLLEGGKRGSQFFSAEGF